ncbi:MAG TPA: hypothetical protein DHV36_00150 [Desulfobacteraceae bacterium]|nr:hypothetical protein [Desulfobacteraceae bacterium]
MINLILSARLKTAFASLENDTPDLLILDLSMPKYNGLSV